MLELLANEANLASELLQRTSSAERVQEIVRLSLAPAFLLAGIGAIMNVMMARLIWVADRIERLEVRMDGDGDALETRELIRLCKRRRLVQHAVMMGSASALTICVVITLLFVSAFISPRIGTLTAVAWILAMLFLISGLMLFVNETLVAARGQNSRGEPGEGS